MDREGKDAQIVQVGKDGTYDPTTGSYSDTDVTTACRIIMFDFALLTNGVQTKAGTLIEANDKQVYMTAPLLVGKPSATGDYLLINGKQWRIMLIKEYNPTTSQTIMYDLLVRK
jgi:hypothetical protein